MKVRLTFDGHDSRRGVLEVGANCQLTVNAIRQTLQALLNVLVADGLERTAHGFAVNHQEADAVNFGCGQVRELSLVGVKGAGKKRLFDLHRVFVFCVPIIHQKREAVNLPCVTLFIGLSAEVRAESKDAAVRVGDGTVGAEVGAILNEVSAGTHHLS